MHLFEAEHKRYTQETLSARDAQRQAECIAWAPIAFQVSRLMIKFGVLDALRDHSDGLTIGEMEALTGLSRYALKILLEASLSIGTVIVTDETAANAAQNEPVDATTGPVEATEEPETNRDRYQITKTGWFLLTDPATRVNIDFNHDVNYRGLFYLEEALLTGRPAGLKTLGDWPTIYEGLSHLDADVQKSWFAFDHFYSDRSFDEALDIVFAKQPKRLMDVGGNTGRFALRCTSHDDDVRVTIVDLPGQIAMMRRNVADEAGAERIDGYATDLLSPDGSLPAGQWDAIWMSQFLDCFSEEQIVDILRLARETMNDRTTLYIMETLWDRQKYEPASLCLTMTSVYFTAMANGNSKMYHSDDMRRLIRRAGLTVTAVHDGLGQGHSILEVER